LDSPQGDPQKEKQDISTNDEPFTRAHPVGSGTKSLSKTSLAVRFENELRRPSSILNVAMDEKESSGLKRWSTRPEDLNGQN